MHEVGKNRKEGMPESERQTPTWPDMTSAEVDSIFAASMKLLLHQSGHLGVFFLDTAELYGPWTNEERREMSREGLKRQAAHPDSPE
jgi:aryl-alcohol dehydrogenase-like predicted oxidoreductase